MLSSYSSTGVLHYAQTWPIGFYVTLRCFCLPPPRIQTCPWRSCRLRTKPSWPNSANGEPTRLHTQGIAPSRTFLRRSRANIKERPLLWREERESPTLPLIPAPTQLQRCCAERA